MRQKKRQAAGHVNVSTTWLYSISDEEREKEQVAKLWERLRKPKPSE
jgi:hypothetical protein